jgi:hypothetical protein
MGLNVVRGRERKEGEREYNRIQFYLLLCHI